VTTDTLSLNNQIGVWTSEVANIEAAINFLWDTCSSWKPIAGANPSIMGGITWSNVPAATFFNVMLSL
jgi:hypothetical protein